MNEAMMIALTVYRCLTLSQITLFLTYGIIKAVKSKKILNRFYSGEKDLKDMDYIEYSKIANAGSFFLLNERDLKRKWREWREAHLAHPLPQIRLGRHSADIDPSKFITFPRWPYPPQNPGMFTVTYKNAAKYLNCWIDQQGYTSPIPIEMTEMEADIAIGKFKQNETLLNGGVRLEKIIVKKHQIVAQLHRECGNTCRNGEKNHEKED